MQTKVRFYGTSGHGRKIGLPAEGQKTSDVITKHPHVHMSLFWFLDHSFVCSYHSNSGPCNSTQTWPVSFGLERTCCFNDKDNYLLSRTRLSWIALCFGMLNMRTTEFHWLYFDYIWTATVLIKREEQLPQKLSEKTVSGLSSVCRPKDGNSRPSDKRSPVSETFNQMWYENVEDTRKKMFSLFVSSKIHVLQFSWFFGLLLKWKYWLPSVKSFSYHPQQGKTVKKLT